MERLDYYNNIQKTSIRIYKIGIEEGVNSLL